MAMSVVIATVLRFDFTVPESKVAEMFWFAAFAAVVFVVCGAVRGLYSGRWSFGVFEEVSALVATIVLATGILMVVAAMLPKVDGVRPIPMSVPLIASTIMLVLSAGVRYMWRLLYDRRLRPQSEGVERVVVIGAGEGGQQIITAMLRNPAGRLLPVALIDDDPSKRNLRVRNVPVGGTRNDLGEVAARHDAGIALLAIPSADSALIRVYAELADEHGLRLLVLPSVSELYGAQVGTSDIRPLTHADLLGRHEVDTDIAAHRRLPHRASGCWSPGAGGSIGSELCRQLYRFAPAKLVMLDRDESALHAVQLSIEGRALLDSRNLVVCDIRDTDRVTQIFEEHRPEVVFHAAALKHLPLLRDAPERGGQDQRVGHPGPRWTPPSRPGSSASSTSPPTRPPTRAACSATRSASPSGSPPRRPTTATATTSACGSATCWAAGARCSPRSETQIEAGGPITVTDPDVTRYFMTVEEAVQLVIQAGAIGRDGEALVLDMGEPVRIDDVAKRLIAEADRPHRDRLHRAAPRREAARGALRRPARSGRRRATPASRTWRSRPSSVDRLPRAPGGGLRSGDHGHAPRRVGYAEEQPTAS